MRVNPATGSIVFNVVYDGLVPATGNSIYAYPAPSAVGDATNTTGRGVVVVSAYGISTTASFCFPAAGQCNAVLWGASGADGSLQWTRNLTGQGWLARDVVADTQTPAVYFFMSNGTVICLDSITGVEVARSTLFTSTGQPFPSRVFDGPFFLALTNNGTSNIVVASNGTGLVAWLPSPAGGAGTLLWSTAATAPGAGLTSYGRPAISNALRRVLVANISSLVAFDLFTGALLWSTPYPGAARALPLTADLGLSRGAGGVAFVSARRNATGACIFSFSVSSGALLGQTCLDPNVIQWGRGFALDSDPAAGGAPARLYMQLYDFRDAVQSAVLTVFSVSNPAAISVLSSTPILDRSSSSLAFIGVGPSGQVFQMARGPSSYAASRSIQDVVTALPTLAPLNGRLTQTNLWTTLLNGTANYTLFAPNSTALSTMGVNVADFFFNSFNLGALSRLLGCHVVPGRFLSSSLANGQQLTTVNGVALTVSVAAGAVTLTVPGGAAAARVVAADYQAPDGVVHVLDTVLVAPGGPTGYPTADVVGVASASSNLTTLVSALAAAGLAGSLAAPAGPFVVFAPTNAAFAAINATNASAATLLGHVVVGPRIYSPQIVNGSTVQTAANTTLTFLVDASGGVTVNGRALVGSSVNVQASNGVIHFLAGVITPSPAPAPPTPSPAGPPSAAPPTAAAAAGLAAVTALAVGWTLARAL